MMTAAMIGIKQAVTKDKTGENNWENTAKKYGISHAKIEEMRPAFDECYR